MDAISNVLALIKQTRKHVNHNTVTDQTHVLVSLGWLHELLNDLEDMALGDLEFEYEEVI